MREFKNVEELSAIKLTDETGTHVFTEEDEVICIVSGEVYIGKLNRVINNEAGQMISIMIQEEEYPVRTTMVGIFTKDITYFSRKNPKNIDASKCDDKIMADIEKLVENKRIHNDIYKKLEGSVALNNMMMDKTAELLIANKQDDEQALDAWRQEMQEIKENIHVIDSSIKDAYRKMGCDLDSK